MQAILSVGQALHFGTAFATEQIDLVHDGISVLSRLREQHVILRLAHDLEGKLDFAAQRTRSQVLAKPPTLVVDRFLQGCVFDNWSTACNKLRASRLLGILTASHSRSPSRLLLLRKEAILSCTTRIVHCLCRGSVLTVTI